MNFVLGLLLVFAVNAYCEENKNDGLLQSVSDKPQTADKDFTAARPDPDKMISELSVALRLSSRQDDRIYKAVSRKAKEFDENMKEYEKNSREEAKWRQKMEESSASLKAITADMPQLIKEFLDEEQIRLYDDFLAARNKPAESAAISKENTQQDATIENPPTPKKKRLVRKKKAPALTEQAVKEGETALPADENAANTGAAAEKPKKKVKRIIKKKAAPQETQEAPQKEETTQNKEQAQPSAEPEGQQEEVNSYP